MIEFLKGTVTTIDKQSIILQAGIVGIMLNVPDGYAFEKGGNATVITYMHWSAEQGPSLYGFSTELERTVFTFIISCNGVGPKLGLAILGTLGAATFVTAVHQADFTTLSKVSGVGIKKAENIVVQLKHKIEPLLLHVADANSTSSSWHELAQVLTTLNYSKPEVQSAMNYVRTETSADHSFDILLRKALAYLTKQQ